MIENKNNKFLLVFAIFTLISNISINEILAQQPSYNYFKVHPLHDAFVWESAPTTNYGSDNYLHLGDISGGRYETYLLFSFPDYPTNFTSARIELYFWGAFSTSLVSCDVYKLNNLTWSENTITWNTRIQQKTNIFSQTIDNSDFSVVLNVTDYISGTILGISLMIPILLTDQCSFYSKDHSNSDAHPILTFVYPTSSTNGTIAGFDLLVIFSCVAIIVYITKYKILNKKR